MGGEQAGTVLATITRDQKNREGKEVGLSKSFNHYIMHHADLSINKQTQVFTCTLCSDYHYLKNKEALTVLYSVVKYVGSSRAERSVGEN